MIKSGAAAFPVSLENDMLIRFGLAMTVSFSLSPVLFAGAPTDAELWAGVWKILDTRCMRCHDGPGATSGVNLRGHEELVQERKGRDSFSFEWDKDPWWYVKAGKAEESLLYHMVETEQMPMGGAKLNKEEKKVIFDWIQKGAPAPPKVVVRPFLKQSQELRAILTYLNTLPEADRRFARFFSFSNLHNNPAIHAEHLAYYKAGLSKLVNGLSWKETITPPKEVPGTHGSVLAIDLRAYGWEKPDAWTLMLTHYPYSFTTDPEQSDALARLSKTPLAVVRADWFAQTASRPPLYHDILNLPARLSELEEKLGIHFEANFKAGKVVRAGYYGASTTTSGYRVSERQEIAAYPGALWRSYDFGLNMAAGGKGNPLVFPLGPQMPGHPFPDKVFKHQGSEVIFNLPNGLQAYLVTDAEGFRMDEPPISVLKDRNEFSGSPALVNGISCMACHADGMNHVVDQVRDEATAKRFLGAQFEFVQKIYPPKSVMDRFLKADRDRFRKAVDQAGKPFLPEKATVPIPPTEMTHALTDLYRRGVRLEEAAFELGIEKPAELKKMLQEMPTFGKGLGFRAAFLREGGQVSRAEWERVFLDAFLMLEAGEPISLAELRLPREVGRGKKFRKFER